MPKFVFKMQSTSYGRRRCYLIVMLLALSTSAFAQKHPLDALTREEIVAATKIVTADPQLRD